MVVPLNFPQLYQSGCSYSVNVSSELGDQVGGRVEDLTSIKIGYRPWNPSWVFYLCNEIGYIVRQRIEIGYGFACVLGGF